ncbi:MAG: EAL domain-containing protein [Cyanobacteria bacterium]|nr:EAL domain-containing protein [Cyanobacteriota bacterium]MDW8201578.1 EAL domain-containing protein [Cyanobacteriota bacterium SKYGB_h_bin112]
MTPEQQKTILVIEDVAALRQEIVETLECLNYHVIAGENGEVGLRLAATYLPDLILCDIMMPELNGYEVYERLRDNADTASIPFIFLSAKADRSDVRRGMNLGADDYLTKPFTSEELSDAIAARLQKQAAAFQRYESEMKQAASSLTQLAYMDPLTNLPNRIQLYERLQETLRRAAQITSDNLAHGASVEPIVAVVWLSLDNLRYIAGQVGDVTSDWLLKEFANRLVASIGQRDIAARLNSHEFCLVIMRQMHPQTIVSTINLVHEQLLQPYQLGSQCLTLQISTGIALYPTHGNTANQVLQYANLAMRHARQLGSNQCWLYDAESAVLQQQRQWLEASLTSALEQSEFALWYQPQVNLITGRVVAAEALLRWQHPRLGIITPAQFLRLAEDRGEMVLIGRWVIQTACAQLASWQRTTMFPLTMCINLSAAELVHDHLVEYIASTVQTMGVQPDMLCLEITEVSVMQNLDLAISASQQLKALGIKLAIDDFGTGYSSLNYLHQLPIDVIKIDHSTVNHLPNDSSSAAIVSSIIALAQSQKLTIVAEGVETQEQLDFLRKHGCSRMQGNLFSPAVSAERFEQLLLSDRRLK